MERYRKAQRAERALFFALLALLAAGGFAYGAFKDDVSPWPLVGGVIAYMCGCYLMYRLALALILRKL